MIFRQDPGLSTDEFILESDRLTIVRKGLGMRVDSKILLEDIDPVAEQTKRCFKRFFLIPLAFAALMIASTWGLSHQKIFPVELALAPAMAAVLFLWHASKGLTPIEVYRVRDRSGKILFELYRPRKSRLRYEEFVQELRKRLSDRVNMRST